MVLEAEPGNFKGTVKNLKYAVTAKDIGAEDMTATLTDIRFKGESVSSVKFILTDSAQKARIIPAAGQCRWIKI